MAQAKDTRTTTQVRQKDARQRTRFSLRVGNGSLTATLFDYFQGKFCNFVTQREGKERAIDAMTAFWQAYALQAKGASSEQQKEAAHQCLHVLMRQVEALCRDFGLASPLVAPAAPARDSAMIETLLQLLQASPALRQQPLPAAVAAPLVQTSPVVADQPFQEDMIFIDDDLLGDLV